MNKEKDFINIINKILNKDSDKNLLVGIGDDAAVISKNSNENTVICSDSIVEGVHFNTEYFSFEDIGWKSISINISDLASMGASPNYYTVSIGVPDSLKIEKFTKIINGIKNCCDFFGGKVVGGDIVSSNKLFISVTAIGKLISNNFMTRGSAKVGDKVAVTGNLGDSLGALNLLKKNKNNKYLSVKHFAPEPKVNQSRELVKLGIKCCTDISDGLHNDLLNICIESKVSVIIDVENIPASKYLIKEFPEEFKDISINGGEDYELLFTFDESKIKLPFDYYVIGEICKKSKYEIFYKNKNRKYLPNLNPWSHFE